MEKERLGKYRPDRRNSAKTEAYRRERLDVKAELEEFYKLADPNKLLARPADDEGWRRLVEHRLLQRRTSVGEGSERLPDQVRRGKKAKLATRGERAIAFMEGFLITPEGPGAGKPLKLLEFQRKFVLDVLDNPAGTRQAILSMGRKNGKTALVAALVLCFIVGPEARTNSQIVSGAMEREQAAIVSRYAEKMAGTPALRALLRIVGSRKRLFGLAANVEFRALAAAAKSAQGLSPVVAILDEVGQIVGPRSDFVSAIRSGQGAYDDALTFVISTQAAGDGDLLSMLIDEALLGTDPKTVCHLYAAPADCALDDEAAWRAANPALDEFRSRADLTMLVQQAMRVPSFANTVRHYNLNQRVEAVAPFVTRSVWVQNGDAARPLTPKTKVWGGLDLGSVADLCGLVLLDEFGGVHTKAWLPQDGIVEKSRIDRAPFDVWAQQGHLLLTPGRAVQYDYVADELAALRTQCDLQVIAFDRWGMAHLRPYLVRAGFDEAYIDRVFLPFSQTYSNMAPAIRSLESRLLDTRLHHGAHPVLTWCAANVRVERNAAGERRFTKQKSTGRIDLMVALAMAVGAQGAGGPAPAEKPKFQMLVL